MLYDTKWDKTETSTLPTFKARWWYSASRLDARPVAWSLRNRPNDWEWRTEDCTIIHTPSQHVFWVSIGGPKLWEADCSCTSSDRKFQRFQRFVFMAALRAWKRQRPVLDPDHFAAHFVR